jgi:hypothetical protein
LHQIEIQLQLFDLALFAVNVRFQHGPQGHIAFGKSMRFEIGVQGFSFQLKILAEHLLEVKRLPDAADFDGRDPTEGDNFLAKFLGMFMGATALRREVIRKDLAP